MGRYVIGDIHGCRAELACLLDNLRLGSSDTVVFLGDYIDRGPDSCGIIVDLLALQRQHPGVAVFLKGNHEDMLLSFLGMGGRYGEMFLYNGGRATAASYGVTSANPRADELGSAMPPEHIAFLRDLRTYHVLDSFLCVHAGIHPSKSLTRQSDAELLWIRDKFIYNPHSLPYTVVYGHTPTRDVLFDLPYKIGLDTGLVYGNKLSCLETEQKILYQITRGEKAVKRTSVSDRWAAAASFPP